MNKNIFSIITALTLLSLFPQKANAASIIATNFDNLSLGAAIVGPVGPFVETSLINANNQGLGDLKSGVFCPAGFTSCVPPQNPQGTIYTYVHQVTPGVDFPNDAPFPFPENIIPFNDVSQFSLGFNASGFNNVVGYSFSQAENALGSDGKFKIKQLDDGKLIWTVSGGEGWNTNTSNPETITFFWQTTQPPSGPGGTYIASNNNTLGSGAGPLPIPVQKVPEHNGILGLLAVSTLLGNVRNLKRKKK
ncbi:MAG: exosortase, PEP-CTERM interaction domain protein [Rivularia sp. T60_A2020_040]|nr:exosortase, PEP-CTERM interaction domain protein [Rivularia sp. T60_A2020_040]